jgi:hypothetical protein
MRLGAFSQTSKDRRTVAEKCRKRVLTRPAAGVSKQRVATRAPLQPGVRFPDACPDWCCFGQGPECVRNGRSPRSVERQVWVVTCHWLKRQGLSASRKDRSVSCGRRETTPGTSLLLRGLSARGGKRPERSLSTRRRALDPGRERPVPRPLGRCRSAERSAEAR